MGEAATRHSGGDNYLYCDGHVKWLTPNNASAQGPAYALAASPPNNPTVLDPWSIIGHD
jgi:prepilin-type processing-associated H-X9-DG protein